MTVAKIKMFLDSSNQFYCNLLGYSIEQTSLKQIPENRWNKFTAQQKLNPNSSGVYLPRSQTAIIKEGDHMSLFHEYFGHGLYCEQNQIGRKLIELERKLLEQEKKEFSNKKFSLEDLQKFRQQNQTFQELKKFMEENFVKYELFAIWTEYLLSEKHNLKEDFEKKYDFLSGKEKEAIDSLINFSSKYGNLATMYAQGMARRTTTERVKRLLEDIYKDKIQEIRFALLYGSKKEFSDIDVFIVGDGLERLTAEWLDLSIYNPKHFEYCLSVFDVAVTDPLLSGEVVISKNNEEVKNYKEKLKSQPITIEALYYNLLKSKEQFLLSLDYPKNSKERKIGLSYSQTYFANYLALKEGKRLFTKNELLSYLQKQAPAEGDKPLHLKGGKI
ncbi:MAG: nucleotidyltransferase domain-containing protein [Candidatus Pacearchaeota archaeon]